MEQLLIQTVQDAAPTFDLLPSVAAGVSAIINVLFLALLASWRVRIRDLKEDDERDRASYEERFENYRSLLQNNE